MFEKLMYLVIKVKDFMCDISAVILYTLLAYKTYNVMGVSNKVTLLLVVLSALYAIVAIVLINRMRKHINK